MTNATLYGIGVGPGDPDAITLEAVRVLRRVPVILVPHSLNRSSVALKIIRRWIRPSRQRLIMQTYPMMGDEKSLETAREASANQVRAILATDSSVAWVTEGDPMLYSTFLDVLTRIRTAVPGVRVKVVPAVSSITACAAASVWPLARRDERVAVLPAAVALDGLKDLLNQFETVVLVKARSTFDVLVERLDMFGLIAEAVLVEDCGRSHQRITRDLRTRCGTQLSYFSTVIISRRGTSLPEDVAGRGAGSCATE